MNTMESDNRQSEIKVNFSLYILITILFFIFTSRNHFIDAEPQSDLDSLIKIYQETKIDSIRYYLGYQIGQRNLDKNPAMALEYLEASYELLQRGVNYRVSNVPPIKLVGGILNGLAIANENAGDINKAIEFRMEFLRLTQQSNDKNLEIIALNNLGSLLSSQNDQEEAISYFRKSLELSLSISDNYNIGLSYGNIGSVISNKDSTRYYYMTSLPYLEKIKSNEGRIGALGWMMNNIGDLYFETGELDSAYHYYLLSKNYRESIDHRLGRFIIYNKLARLHESRGKTDSAIFYINKSIDLGSDNNFVSDLNESYLFRSEILRKAKKYKEALDDYILGITLRDSAVSEENAKNILRQTMKYEHEKSKLADSLEYSKKEAVLIERSQKQRIGLIAMAGGLLLLFLLARTIQKGKKRSDTLLLNILPGKVAEELKRKGYADAKLFNQVTVLFTDFKDFTKVSEKLSPTELVDEINFCYSEFDRIITKYNLEKIKTIGDSYMCAGGLPVANKTHASDAVKAALEIRDFMLREKKNKMSEGKPAFEIRIGLHTGPVVAGIVGIKKFSYDIWGDTVNIASRMESSGETGKVNISSSTYEEVKDQFTCFYRGKISAKNKGDFDMYFVEAHN